MKCRELFPLLVVAMLCVGTLLSVFTPDWASSTRRLLQFRSAANNRSSRHVLEIDVNASARASTSDGLVVEIFRRKRNNDDTKNNNDGDSTHSAQTPDDDHDPMAVNRIRDPTARMRQFRRTCLQAMPRAIPATSTATGVFPTALDIPYQSVAWRNFLCTRGTQLATILPSSAVGSDDGADELQVEKDNETATQASKVLNSTASAVSGKKRWRRDRGWGMGRKVHPIAQLTVLDVTSAAARGGRGEDATVATGGGGASAGNAASTVGVSEAKAFTLPSPSREPQHNKKSRLAPFLAPSGGSPQGPSVLFHESVLLFAAPLGSLFHSWFDATVVGAWLYLSFDDGRFFNTTAFRLGGAAAASPSPSVSSRILEVEGEVSLTAATATTGGVALGAQATQPPLLQREVTVAAIKGMPTAGSSVHGIVKMSVEFFASRRSLVRDQAQTDADTDRIHCYCGGAMLGNGVLTSTGAPDDPIREQATRWAVTQLLHWNTLLPLGTSYPIDVKEYGKYGMYVGQNVPAKGKRPARASASSRKQQTPTTPRMLILLRRTSRVIGDQAALIALAQDIGFNVEAIYPEDYPTHVQLHTARYADILMAAHGMALTWMVAMDGFSNPKCRHVVELRFFGRKLKGFHNVYHTTASNSKLAYFSWAAADVIFDPTWVLNPQAERNALKKRAFPHLLRGFKFQTTFYDMNWAKVALQGYFEALRECLPNKR